MAVFQWSEKYSVGDNTMDSHHQKLFDILNVLLDAMKEGRGEEILDTQLDKLASYAKYHFDAEERLMADIRYPGLGAQQQAHKAFLDKVTDYKAATASGNGSFVISSVVTTVKEWLKQHILTMDMQYESYLANSDSTSEKVA